MVSKRREDLSLQRNYPGFLKKKVNFSTQYFKKSRLISQKTQVLCKQISSKQNIPALLGCSRVYPPDLCHAYKKVLRFRSNLHSLWSIQF